MAIEPGSVLYSGIFVAIACELYGLFVGALWSPFLLFGRLRALFDALPPDEWWTNYVLWIPVPAALWGFLFGTALSLSMAVRQTGPASPAYVGGIDGIVVATGTSVGLWLGLLLVVLPSRGIDWYAEEDTVTTVALVVAATAWYFLFLVGPAYVLSVFAGFGDAMSGA